MKKCANCGHENAADATKCSSCGADLTKAITKAKEGDDLAEGTILTSQADLSPLWENQSQLVIPKRGKVFNEDGVGKFSIIRPCQSRGRPIRGLQPIYESQMLARNAAVFKGWPMYIDHMDEQLAEEVAEFLRERGRSLNDLGGRLINTFYDPELTFEDDEEYGFRKGGVVGEVIPQRKTREMCEDDPGCLNVSINAWPTKVSVGSPTWDRSKKGAVIEGIRPKPMGSVDFVFRGGAGGRPLTEEERRSTVSLLEAAYDSGHDDDRPKGDPVKKKLSELSQDEIKALKPEELKEIVERDAPHLAEAFAPKKEKKDEPVVEGEGTITAEQLNEALTKQRTAIVEEFSEKLSENEEKAREKADEIVKEREGLRTLSEFAEGKLAEVQKNGLPAEYVTEIRKGYLLLASGARPGLLVEEDVTDDDGNKMTAEQVIEERIKGDVKTAIKLIEAAGGTPRVKGFGPTKEDENGDGGKKPALREGSDAFEDFLRESGDLTGDKEKDDKRLAEMLEEGV